MLRFVLFYDGTNTIASASDKAIPGGVMVVDSVPSIQPKRRNTTSVQLAVLYRNRIAILSHVHTNESTRVKWSGLSPRRVRESL